MPNPVLAGRSTAELIAEVIARADEGDADAARFLWGGEDELAADIAVMCGRVAC